MSQYLQLNEVLLPATNTMLSFKSLLGYATTDEVAHVQVSTDGGANWQDLFVEAGNNGSGEPTAIHGSFAVHCPIMSGN